MEKDEVIEDDEIKTTLKVPAELLDDFKHLAIDIKTTVTALIVDLYTYITNMHHKTCLR